MKICVVAWDVIGASKTTGVAIFNHEISRFLKDGGHDVTILYTQSIYHYKDITEIVDLYSDLGIKFIDLGVWANQYYNLYDKTHTWYNYNSIINYYLFISDEIRDFLETYYFDLVIFSECNGNGYRAIQAKHTDISLKDTKLVCVMHGSLHWCRQGIEFFDTNFYNFDQLVLNYCEEYSVRYCDEVISPSKYMFEWAEKNEWKLPTNKRVIPYIYENRFKKFNYDPQKYKITEITFFGRLEARKGLHLFIDAIIDLKRDGVLNEIKKINFFGPETDIMGVSASNYIKEAFKDLNINYTVKDIPYEQIQTYLLDRGNRNLVVIPSIMDNFPFTIIEVIYMGIPVIASNVGGIPELIGRNHEHLLFEPTVMGIYNKIKDIMLYNNGEFFNLKNLNYDNEKVKKIWRNFLIEIEDKKENKRYNKVENNRPVTVIIGGDYKSILKEAIKSIELQSIDNLNIIVLIKLLKDEDEYKIQDLKFRFPDCTIIPTHGNLNIVKNNIISKIKTDYIVFVDGNVIADYNMIKDLVSCIQTSNLTALTAYNTYYYYDEVDPFNVSIKRGRAAIGGSYLLSLFENIFEDRVFIIKRESLMEIGGFDVDLNDDTTTWDIFSKLMLRGYNCDTIPRVLYNTLYRKVKINQGMGIQIVLKNYPRDALKNINWELIKEYLVMLHRIRVTNIPSATKNKVSPIWVEAPQPIYLERTSALLTLFGNIPFAKNVILKLARLHHLIFCGRKG